MRQQSMTNSLFKIRARAFGVETPASRYGPRYSVIA